MSTLDKTSAIETIVSLSFVTCSKCLATELPATRWSELTPAHGVLAVEAFHDVASILWERTASQVDDGVDWAVELGVPCDRVLGVTTIHVVLPGDSTTSSDILE